MGLMQVRATGILVMLQGLDRLLDQVVLALGQDWIVDPVAVVVTVPPISMERLHEGGPIPGTRTSLGDRILPRVLPGPPDGVFWLILAFILGRSPHMDADMDQALARPVAQIESREDAIPTGLIGQPKGVASGLSTQVLASEDLATITGFYTVDRGAAVTISPQS